MKLTLATAALQVLLFANNAHESIAFSVSNPNVKRVSYTRLHADVDDIVKAYSKKKAVAEISLPEKLSDTTVAATPDVTSPPTVAEIISTPPPPSVSEVVSTPPIEPITPPSNGEALPLGDYIKQMRANDLASKPPIISPPKDDSVVNLKEMMKGALTKPEYTPPTVEEGKVLPLSDYLKQVSSTDFVKPENNFDPLLNAQEKLSILKQNFQGMPQGLKSSLSDTADVSKIIPENPATTKLVTNSADLLKPAADSFAKFSETMGAAAASGASATSSVNFAGLIESLHLKEYGSWYVTAAALVYASSQKNSGKEEARKEFEAELTAAKEQALEAAALATNAADLATESKVLAAKVQVENEGTSTLGVLEDSKRKELEFENDLMKQEINKLISQTSQLENQISALTKSSAIEETEPVEKAPRVLEVMPRDPDEDSRILDVLKEIDAENEKKFAAAKIAKTPTIDASDTKAAAAAAEAKLKAAAEALAIAEAEEKAAKEALAAAEEQERLLAEARAAVEAAEARAAVEAAEAEAAAKASAAKKKKKKQKKKAPPKKAPAKKKIEETVSTDEPHPWTKLTKSGLSRKTVKELSEFLSERGVVTTGENGKARVKKELLEEVTQLL